MEVNALGVGKTDHHHALVGRRNIARDERVGRVDHGYALKVHVGVGELRNDVVHIVRHAAQDGVGDRLGAVAPLVLVAPQLLDPLQVDHRHHANAQIRVLGDVVLRRHQGAVQALIKQDVGALWQLFPGGEGAGLLLKRLGFFGVVQVFAGPACPRL